MFASDIYQEEEIRHKIQNNKSVPACIKNSYNTGSECCHSSDYIVF